MASSEARRRLWSIPLSRPFADDLAAGLLAGHAGQLELARVLLLLPTRRAIRALTDAFVRQSEGRALLLPRMVPAGDLEADALEDWASAPVLGGLEGPADVRPAIAPQARRLALARLLSGPLNLPAAEALALGASLGAALDTLEIEGRRAAEVAEAVPAGNLEEHWARNARVLEAVMRGWPELLEERGLIDAARRRNLQLDGLAERWAKAPPAFPVVMAGFSSAPPAVARLARTILRLPTGQLVLPGLDLRMGAEGWALVGGQEGPSLETHPQHGMARLLKAAGVSPLEARPWPFAAPGAGSPEARAALVARALQPPALSGAAQPAPEPAALEGLRMLEAATPAEEALAIAIALRQVVNHPGATAALVTPDRGLAARVSVQLRRFGIEIDDSAGEPLKATPPGSLLVALATAAGEAFAPVSLLALLQHPLVRQGEARLDWLNRVRHLDRAALRGIRPGPGLHGVARRLRTARAADDGLRAWWADEVAALLAPLQPVPATAEALIDTLKSVAAALAGEALWVGDSGRALARLLEALEDCRPDLARLPVTADDAAAFITALMAGETVRPRFSRHPQLAIWGPLEARLQSADLLVMGGLNEGVWPGVPAPDPFLAPAIRRALDLPGLARRTGLQAHDFAAGLGAPQVLLTRSLREGGAPSVASRFWQRLRAAARDLPDSGSLSPPREALLATARALDRPAIEQRYPRPEPAPPAADRPRLVRVTEVAQLKADPFAFYARRMLGLQPLDPRDAEPTAGERGQAVHKVLEHWLDERPAGREALEALVDRDLGVLAERPELAALWRPRVLRLVEWVLAELDREAEWAPVAWEKEAETEWRGVTLKGRVDRIDRKGAALRIIDYKTGAVPPAKEVAELYQTQLALLATMAEQGRFGLGQPLGVERLDYLKLSGGREPGELKPALGKKADADALAKHIDDAFQDFQALAAAYLLGARPFRAKLDMVHGRKFRDYDQLARVAEWLGR